MADTLHKVLTNIRNIAEYKSTDYKYHIERKRNGEQFTITNQDSFDWQQVTLFLNSDYELYTPVIEANTIYTVGAMQFTKRDGTMFNPFTMKPLHMSITGENSEGVQGWWHGGW